MPNFSFVKYQTKTIMPIKKSYELLSSSLARENDDTDYFIGLRSNISQRIYSVSAPSVFYDPQLEIICCCIARYYVKKHVCLEA